MNKFNNNLDKISNWVKRSEQYYWKPRRFNLIKIKELLVEQ